MWRSGKRLARWVVACGLVAGWAIGLPAGAAATSTPTGERAYELVSPRDKNGGDIVADSQRTRAAQDGSAVGFLSLSGFGDVVGAGVAVDYLSVRSTNPNPGTSGWATHAITPRQDAGSLVSLFAQLEPLYVGEFDPNLDKGVFFARSSLTDDPNIARTLNLYLRTDLRTPGPGTFEAVTLCPLCELTATPLPPTPGSNAAFGLRPLIAGSSPDLERIAFESRQPLTVDDPANGRVHLFEWEAGQVQLVGRVPVNPAIECDDVNGPFCNAAPISVAGLGASNESYTPHTVSDGSDGHHRVFFTLPTNSGGTPEEGSYPGRVFMRVDNTTTAQLNASERTTPDGFAPARYLDAAADGSRVFISTSQALTDDAPADGQVKLYMYDATKPPSAPDNLSFLSADEEPVIDDGTVEGFVGASDDGSYAYFIASGQLVRGEEALVGLPAIYVWHDGTLRFVGQVMFGYGELMNAGSARLLNPRQSRVTPDGRYVLFSAIDGTRLGGYDHGSCASPLGRGCREFYLYNADSGERVCVSCNPTGATATAMASIVIRDGGGGSQTSTHETKALADDGSRVFFNTAEALVPDDTNGKIDAYEYVVAQRRARLLSSGKSTTESWFLDASRDGRDAFFVTRSALVGWDGDAAYDLYDARVGGGFPEPPPTPAPCSGDACQGAFPGPPTANAPGSSTFRGTGNVREAKPKPKPTQCRRGFVKKRVRTKNGTVKRKCVKRQRRASARGKRARTERRGS